MAAAKPRAARARRNGNAATKPHKNFRVFALHATDPVGRRKLDRLTADRVNFAAFGLGATRPEELDSETAAKHLLNHALASSTLPDLVRPKTGDSESEFRSLGTELMPVTGTKFIKFRQYIKGIPVYGTLVTIELDEQRECLAVNATIATPNVDSHLATVSPLRALKAAAKEAGYGDEMPQVTPLLYFFLDRSNCWRLVYMIENVRTRAPRPKRGVPASRHTPLVYDYVVDAMDGKLVAELPRTPSMAALTTTARDELGAPQTFRIAEYKGKRRMRDPVLNLETYDFRFGDPRANSSRLPGTLCGPPWSEAAVSAHVNGGLVASYLREVLKRNNIDNKGGRMVSVVNCLVQDKKTDGRVWQDAFWDGRHMVYGQMRFNGRLRSLASNLDVVAHEAFHGVTSNTARLEYLFETGALNESYSDIFGILISNRSVADIGAWDWKLADGLNSNKDAYRNLRDPSLCGQPMHYRKYQERTLDQDKGGVHINSGIHNCAAYNIMAAQKDGAFLFTPTDLAAMFYVALTQHLARQATFSASRRAVLLATRSYFRKLPTDELEERVQAVEDGFAAAGIGKSRKSPR
jgi:Zn-dependent metalloprotease